MNDKISVTVGICAYNEESNIGRSVMSAIDQRLNGFELSKVIVVSSNSTDMTDDIVRGLMVDNPSLALICQDKREGKNSAINCLLDNKDTEILVLLNADNAFRDETCLQKLLEPFSDPKVGIVGGRPIPVNDEKSIAGFASHMIWTMHHHISLVYPKIGEIIAFRDLSIRLPKGTQSDEDILKMEIERKGYISVYSPDAVVFNRGPDTVRDFLKQRTRVNIGECYIEKDHNYEIPTRNMHHLYPALVCTVKDMGFHPVKYSLSMMLELYAKLRAKMHVVMDEGDLNVWDPVKTTKKL